jgi:formylglycine-generating enzyme required for sulfatase activity
MLVGQEIDTVSVTVDGSAVTVSPNPSAPNFKFTMPGGAASAPVISVTLKSPSTYSASLSDQSLEMIWVEPGTFTMGDSDITGTLSQWHLEHEVTLTQGFYLGKYEVTQAQYEAVMTGNTDGLSATPSNWPNNPDRPVEQVSWNDVQVFFARLNEQQASDLPAGWEYALPTEAEWEYACRAGTTTNYYWGDSITISNANYRDSGYSQTRDVGQYSANPWGFFDMHGNVHEWTADWYAPFSLEAQTDPVGPETGSRRAFRGGSWNTQGSSMSAAQRGSSMPDGSFNELGFRVALKQIS